jgi:divalent metal cation (Fe/Co/Zn/Cd) transporter
MSKLTSIDLKDYRQPVVTSLGIILGFLLGFLGQWVTEDTFSLKQTGDIITFLGSITGMFLLLIALFRMLLPSEPSEQALAKYQSILRMYAIGVVIPLASILMSAFL